MPEYFFPLPARKSSGFALMLPNFVAENDYVKNSGGGGAAAGDNCNLFLMTIVISILVIVICLVLIVISLVVTGNCNSFGGNCNLYGDNLWRCL